MKKNQQHEELLYGKKKTLTLPSRYSVTIREQNGADDDIISNQDTARDLTNIDIFLSSLIIDTDLPFAKGGKLSKSDVNKILLRDKYFIMFASRIHSMGSIVKFQFDWGEKNGGKVEYEEDISTFIWDYSKPFPEEGDSDYEEERIQPYEAGSLEPVESVLTSGKEIKFNRLDGQSEKDLLKVQTITRNTIYKARRLQQKDADGKWVNVQNFTYFSKRDMAELNRIVKDTDPEFRGTTELVNPRDPENIIEYPIMRAESFFYPEEI